MSAAPVLAIDDLSVRFDTPDGVVEAVRGVSLSVSAGECLGVVGESGSGKSQIVLAAMGLLANNGRASGRVRFRGDDILGLQPRFLNRVRGSRMTMIFQDPLTALTPHVRIGEQIAEPLRVHGKLSRREAEERALAWLVRVRIPEPSRRMRQYPHELSGGMRQRVMIAAAMACGPDLLIADEPTTALDATIQAEILDLMAQLQAESGAAMILITHDMGIVARMADRVCVMRGGEMVETGTANDVLTAPTQAYTRALLDAVPRLDRDVEPARGAVAANAPIVVEGHDVKVWFAHRGSLFAKPSETRALDGVSFHIRSGETLGVVGESGSGKSTLARAVLRLTPATAGAVTLLGRDLTGADQKALRAARRDLQIVFQDPLASLDPRATIGSSIAEPLLAQRPDLSRADRWGEVAAMMQAVGLSADLINRYPHALSGGQNQRVGIARAMILEPALVICDEAVSALDVSVQAQIIDLLINLQIERGLAMMFISHDLAVVRRLSHRVMVLYQGQVVETGDQAQIFTAPNHPYTRTLLAAALDPDPVRARALRTAAICV